MHISRIIYTKLQTSIHSRLLSTQSTNINTRLTKFPKKRKLQAYFPAVNEWTLRLKVPCLFYLFSIQYEIAVSQKYHKSHVRHVQYFERFKDSHAYTTNSYALPLVIFNTMWWSFKKITQLERKTKKGKEIKFSTLLKLLFCDLREIF